MAVLGNTDRDVMPIGLALLGVTDGPGTAPDREGPLRTVLTLVLLIAAIGPVLTMTFGGRSRWWPAPDRLRLVSGIVGAAGSLAVARLLGAWLTLPGPLWTVAVAALAGATALAVLRWRDLPTVHGGHPRSRWANAAVSLAVGTGVLVASAVFA